MRNQKPEHRNQKFLRSLFVLSIFLFVSSFVFAQDAMKPEGTIPSLKFKDAEIEVVIQAIAQKAFKDGTHINILIAPELEGLVTIDLQNVHWQTALEAVLKMYDSSYEWVGEDIIMVTTLEKLAEKREKETAAAMQEPLETVTYRLSYLDAQDVKKVMESQLTGRGKITILETAPQKGWKARGGFSAGSSGTTAEGDFERVEREKGAQTRTKTFVITDTKTNLRNIIEAIKEIDIAPKQVLIEARIMEVARDRLKDIGLDYGTGSTGVTGSTYSHTSLDDKRNKATLGALITGGQVAPSVFGPKTDINETIPFDAGLEFAFRKLTGNQFEIVLHALEEDVNTNTLSAPSILTIDGQEAYIMVGEKRPIIKSSISSSDTDVGISKELNYYQNLGIELNVVPQVCDDKYINMIIYPSVTSSSNNVSATSQIGSSTSTDNYPIIEVREAQTQIMIKDGETVSIGGLLKDVTKEGIIKVPFLGDIPFLGKLFQRTTYDTEKMDLIIFITAHIIEPGELPQTAKLGTEATASEMGE
ncbi:MAG: hypothetical protein ABH872_02195 [Candidatus Omnitrophota bacterium]